MTDFEEPKRAMVSDPDWRHCCTCVTILLSILTVCVTFYQVKTSPAPARERHEAAADLIRYNSYLQSFGGNLEDPNFIRLQEGLYKVMSR